MRPITRVSSTPPSTLPGTVGVGVASGNEISPNCQLLAWQGVTNLPCAAGTVRMARQALNSQPLMSSLGTKSGSKHKRSTTLAARRSPVITCHNNCPPTLYRTGPPSCRVCSKVVPAQQRKPATTSATQTTGGGGGGAALSIFLCVCRLPRRSRTAGDPAPFVPPPQPFLPACLPVQWCSLAHALPTGTPG